MAADPTYNSADPEAVQRAQMVAAQREKGKHDAFLTLLQHPDGRAWVWEELTAARIFQSSHEPGDPLTTAFREGERNAGLRLLALVNKVAPEAYIMMQREAAA